MNANPTPARVAGMLLLASLSGCEGMPGNGSASGSSAVELQASDVNVLGASDEIAVVRDLEVLPDGTVWVLNSVEPLFVGFAPEGEILQMHGRLGGGPGEFGAPAGFVAGGIEGEAWVFDWQRHSLVEVSRPDAALREIALPRESLPQGSVAGGMNLLSNLVRTGTLGEAVILPRRAEPLQSTAVSFWHSVYTADLVALQLGADSVREVIALGSFAPEGAAPPSPTFIPFPLWFRLWAVCGEGVRAYDRYRDELRGFSLDGSELGPIALPPPRYSQVSPHEFAKAAFDLAVVEGVGQVDDASFSMSAADSATIIERMVQRLDATPEQLLDVLPRYVDLRCGDDGTHWLRPLDIDRGGLRGGPLWLRVTPDGETTRVHFPARFEPYRFVDGKAWGVLLDQYDVASVAWVTLPSAR